MNSFFIWKQTTTQIVNIFVGFISTPKSEWSPDVIASYANTLDVETHLAACVTAHNLTSSFKHYSILSLHIVNSKTVMLPI